MYRSCRRFDAAFGKFFTRLANDGISKDNTLFVITADENDHFAGDVTKASPAGCDGVHTPCTYPTGAKGEVDANLNKLFQGEFTDNTVFTIISTPTTPRRSGSTAQTDLTTRKLEQEAAGLTGYDPITAATNQITQALADQAEQKLLHMVTSDPQRTPNLL